MTGGPGPAEGRRLFDAGLQPERTTLAWRRTGLALTVAAVVAIRILTDVIGTWAVMPAGFGLLGAVVVLVAAHRRHRVVHGTLVASASDRVALPSGRLPLLLTVLVSGGGVGALVVVVVSASP